MLLETEISKRKEIAIEAAKKAGIVLSNNFKKSIKTKSKGNRQLVTEADLKAEGTIVELIKAKFPDDNILSEETKYPILNTPFRWIIDPMDGTHNYIHGIDIFGTSIALEYNKKVVLGVIYMPLSDELYVAVKTKGTYRNGKKINVSKRSLCDATVIYDSSIRYDKKATLWGLEKLSDEIFNIRMFGSTVRGLTYIAEGKIDVEIEFSDKLWDFAAGLLLVEEAGGKATDFKGGPWSTDTKHYIASNGVVHKDILKLMTNFSG